MEISAQQLADLLLGIARAHAGHFVLEALDDAGLRASDAQQQFGQLLCGDFHRVPPAR